MAGSLSIRNVDDDVIVRLKQRAAGNGRSAEAEVRVILRQTLMGDAPKDFFELAAQVRALTAGRQHTPPDVLVREGRDER